MQTDVGRDGIIGEDGHWGDEHVALTQNLESHI